LIAPRRHSLLWRFGPEGYKRTEEGFAQCSNLVRVLAAAEIGGGMWLTGFREHLFPAAREYLYLT
jgi:hypothetical protein